MQNCYNSGKIGREAHDEQDKRLTNKHIKTLSFLQDIAEENKQLKARVTDLEVCFRNPRVFSIIIFLQNLEQKLDNRMKSPDDPNVTGNYRPKISSTAIA